MSMGENNGLRCYMKSPELGCTLRMHSTKWKIIWILLSFPNPGLALSSPQAGEGLQSTCCLGLDLSGMNTLLLPVYCGLSKERELPSTA